MASITISNLQPAGSEFFLDSENYINEISEREFLGVQGGSITAILASTSILTPALPKPV